MVEILSRTGLPIYIKEHPRISANRSIEYYNKILSFKNTFLVPKEFNVYALIDKSFAVANCTGTAGWEATLRCKPSLLFGFIHYQYAPYSFMIKNLGDCLKAIDKIKKTKINKNKVIGFLKGLEEYLIPQKHKNISLKFNEMLLSLDKERIKEKEVLNEK